MPAARQLTLVAAITLSVTAAACGSGDATASTQLGSPRITATSSTPTSKSTTASPTASKAATSKSTKAASPRPTPRPLVTQIKGSKKQGYDLDFSKQPPFTGPAAKLFGAKNVMAAYKETVDFSLTNGYTNRNLLAKIPKQTFPGEFPGLKAYMTPSVHALWTTSIKRAIKGDKKAFGTVAILTPWSISSPALKVPTISNDPTWVPSYGFDFSRANTVVGAARDAKTKALGIRFDVTQNVRFIKPNKKTVAYPVTRDMTYWLVPNPNKKTAKDIPWLIDGWSGTTSRGKALVDPFAGMK